MYFDLRKYIIAALLTTLVWLMALTPFGYIPLFGVDVTLICIPVIVGTCALGLQYGLFLGFMFGLTSLYMSLMGRSGALLMPLLDVPRVLYPLIFIPRLLIPVVTYFTYKLTKKWKAPLSFALSALVGSLGNTLFFLSAAFILGAKVLTKSFQMDQEELFSALVQVAISNGLPEAAVSVLVSVPVLMLFQKAFSGRKGIVERD